MDLIDTVPLIRKYSLESSQNCHQGQLGQVLERDAENPCVDRKLSRALLEFFSSYPITWP